MPFKGELFFIYSNFKTNSKLVLLLFFVKCTLLTLFYSILKFIYQTKGQCLILEKNCCQLPSYMHVNNILCVNNEEPDVIHVTKQTDQQYII